MAPYQPSAAKRHAASPVQPSIITGGKTLRGTKSACEQKCVRLTTHKTVTEIPDTCWCNCFIQLLPCFLQDAIISMLCFCKVCSNSISRFPKQIKFKVLLFFCFACRIVKPKKTKYNRPQMRSLLFRKPHYLYQYRIVVWLLVAQSVQRLTMGWKVRDRIPVGTRFSAQPDRPWGPPSLL